MVGHAFDGDGQTRFRNVANRAEERHNHVELLVHVEFSHVLLEEFHARMAGFRDSKHWCIHIDTGAAVGFFQVREVLASTARDIKQVLSF